MMGRAGPAERGTLLMEAMMVMTMATSATTPMTTPTGLRPPMRPRRSGYLQKKKPLEAAKMAPLEEAKMAPEQPLRHVEGAGHLNEAGP